MTARFQQGTRAAAILALALGLWGWSASQWAAAQTAPPQKPAVGAAADRVEERAPTCTSEDLREIAALVNDEPITCYDVEHRARLLVLFLPSFDLGRYVEEARQRLQEWEDNKKRLSEFRKMLPLPDDFHDHLGIYMKSLDTKHVLQRRLAELKNSALVSLHKQALAELIDDRLKLQAAKRLGIEVPDDEVRRLLANLAERYNMAIEQLAQYLKTLDIDSTTMGERLRAQEAWRSVIAKLMRDLSDQMARGIDTKAPLPKR